MQYVRSIGGSAYSAWQSINPATLSGAIDVVVVEQDDQSLACSPFHIRFGKWRLLRPFEKKVEFKVNGVKQEYPMKLGEGGEAFFVFETQESVPEALQTSPLVSPATSPELRPSQTGTPALQEPDPFELESSIQQRDNGLRRTHTKSTSDGLSPPPMHQRAQSEDGSANLRPHAQSTGARERPLSTAFTGLKPKIPRLERNVTDGDLPTVKAAAHSVLDDRDVSAHLETRSSPLKHMTERSSSPPPPSVEDAKERARNLSTKLWRSNISNQVTDSGDLMLDMNGFKSGDGEALHAEVIARQLLSEEMDGPYDIGALIGADEKGNVWIYSSEEAKEAAGKKAAEGLGSYNPAAYLSTDALSDPGYHSDDARSDSNVSLLHNRRDSDSALGIASQPGSPGHIVSSGDPNKNYAKTLRLTSDQLKAMDLKPGANTMSFTVNRATCNATLWYWKYDVPIVISDIDGTITKSDVLGHVLNTIGRDWTHQGVAKLYTDIASNGYNFLYLTSRSVGQADTTKNYLEGVVQEGYRLPKGPVILSPDRTIAALRREVYLRKPELFKMACLRDIMTLFSTTGGTSHPHEDQSAGLHRTVSHSLGPNRGKAGSPFYAGFGNRLTDALSYRSVNIPSTRIFTINSNSEITLDLLSLNKYRTAYSTMREVVDHFFPPVGLLVKGGGEEFTDFNYWRDKPLDIVDFTDSESEDEDNVIDHALVRAQTNRTMATSRGSILSEDEAGADEMLESFMSDPRASLDETLSEALDDAEGDDMLSSSILQEEDEDGDDEFEVGDDGGEDELDAVDHVEDESSDGGPTTPQPTQGEWGGSEGEGDVDVERTPRRSGDLPVRRK